MNVNTYSHISWIICTRINVIIVVVMFFFFLVICKKYYEKAINIYLYIFVLVYYTKDDLWFTIYWVAIFWYLYFIERREVSFLDFRGRGIKGRLNYTLSLHHRKLLRYAISVLFWIVLYNTLTIFDAIFFDFWKLNWNNLKHLKTDLFCNNY